MFYTIQQFRKFVDKSVDNYYDLYLNFETYLTALSLYSTSVYRTNKNDLIISVTRPPIKQKINILKSLIINNDNIKIKTI